MIVIVDYGRGNLRSVHKAFENLGFKAKVSRDPKEIEKAEKLVLPGVGAFGDCMDNLRMYGLIEPILSFIESGRIFLGICLGLQLLFTESEEFGPVRGLDVIGGRVVRFRNSLKVPHMGWNQVSLVNKDCPIFKGIKDNSFFYFVHSYFVVPEKQDVVCGVTEYGVEFVSAVWKNNIFAVQFHPEKSQKLGLKVLENFARL